MTVVPGSSGPRLSAPPRAVRSANEMEIKSRWSAHLRAPSLGLLCGVAALAGFAQPPTAPLPPTDRDGHWCATGARNDDRLEEVRSWVQRRDRALEKHGALEVARPDTRIESDIILLDATPSMIPFHSPFDLENRSVTYSPVGDGTFSVSTSALAYDEDVGPRLHAFEVGSAPGWFYRVRDLEALEFSFGGQKYTRLYITASNAIHFSPPSFLEDQQLNTAEALSLDGPLVAPLMQRVAGAIFPLPEVFVKESAEAVTVTWRSLPSEWNFALDIQARLESSGRIIFSYRTVREFCWGAAVVTTGSEPWRSTKERLYAQGTPATPVDGSIQQMLDVRSVTIDRIGGSNLLEITLTVPARIRAESLPQGRSLGYYVELKGRSGDGDWVYLHVTRDRLQTRTPGWGWESASAACGIEANSVRFRVLQEAFNLTASPVSANVWTYDSATQGAYDGMTGAFALPAAPADAGSDLSAISSPRAVTGPVVEAFTLGVLEPEAVWSELKAAYPFHDAQVDGVAIFQDFFTDIILYAGAYSTVGNPGADGVATLDGYGTGFPRSPALLHMNRTGYRWNADLPRSFHVLSHELGHRWLYFIDVDQGSGRSSVLQPLGGHPAQYVHTPAAFKVRTDTDSSTMGGATFDDRGGGIFVVPPDWGYYGYSWHELYLMGLAAPEEVDDWFYIANSSPELGGAYSPPPGITVTGIRRNVSLDDVIRAMGPRSPTVATSQKKFRVVFVLLSVPGTTPARKTIEQLDEQRIGFERSFRVATGQRGEVYTTLVPVRRRGVRP